MWRFLTFGEIPQESKGPFIYLTVALGWYQGAVALAVLACLLFGWAEAIGQFFAPAILGALVLASAALFNIGK